MCRRIILSVAASCLALFPCLALAASAGSAGCTSSLIVSNNHDTGAGSLRQAVIDACAGGTIAFADIMSVDLASEIVIDKQVIIDGSSVALDASAGDASMVRIRGQENVRSFRVTASGDLTLRSVRISDGVPNDLGGGVRSKGRLAVFDSRFDHNIGSDTGGLGGGAIYTDVDSVLVVDGSTFDGNDARRGSAIFAGGQSVISNSTFSGNGPTLQSEGVIQNRGTLVGTHLTISSNGTDGFGGVFAFNADTTLINTIIAGNGGTQCQASGGTVSTTALLSTSGNCPSALSDDPLLGGLAANGGPTMTLALHAGSPALDIADAQHCPPTDQRGFARPSGEGCDLGAFEFDQDPIFADGFDGAAVGVAAR